MDAPSMTTTMTPEELAKEALRSAGMVLNHNTPPIIASIAAAIRSAVEAEREACAKMCDEGVSWYPEPTPTARAVTAVVKESCAKLARDIRARGAGEIRRPPTDAEMYIEAWKGIRTGG